MTTAAGEGVKDAGHITVTSVVINLAQRPLLPVARPLSLSLSPLFPVRSGLAFKEQHQHPVSFKDGSEVIQERSSDTVPRLLRR